MPSETSTPDIDRLRELGERATSYPIEFAYDIDVPGGAWDWIEAIATAHDGPHRRLETPKDSETILYWQDEQLAAAVVNVRDQFNRSVQLRIDFRAAGGNALLAQLEAATARIGVLKEALEPFAKDADDWYTPGVHYDDSLELWQTGRTSVTVGHLRAARSALNSHADGASPSKETAA